MLACADVASSTKLLPSTAIPHLHTHTHTPAPAFLLQVYDAPLDPKEFAQRLWGDRYFNPGALPLLPLIAAVRSQQGA